MGVIPTEACDDNLLTVSFSVSIGVLDKEQIRGIGYPDPAVSDGNSAGDIKTFHKDGGLIGAAIAIGIFEDSDAVFAWTG